MSELAERVKKLRLATWDKVGFDTNDDWYTSQYDKLIEQALLAERRLVMEEAIAIADNEGLSEEVGAGDLEYNTAIIHVCKALRAAAEKEVGK